MDCLYKSDIPIAVIKSDSYGNIGILSEELTSESVATFPPFGPIEGKKWFDRISSQ
jgi:hypothetical protein